jgi:hypothetical protein
VRPSLSRTTFALRGERPLTWSARTVQPSSSRAKPMAVEPEALSFMVLKKYSAFSAEVSGTRVLILVLKDTTATCTRCASRRERRRSSTNWRARAMPAAPNPSEVSMRSTRSTAADAGTDAAAAHTTASGMYEVVVVEVADVVVEAAVVVLSPGMAHAPLEYTYMPVHSAMHALANVTSLEPQTGSKAL